MGSLPDLLVPSLFPEPCTSIDSEDEGMVRLQHRTGPLQQSLVHVPGFDSPAGLNPKAECGVGAVLVKHRRSRVRFDVYPRLVISSHVGWRRKRYGCLLEEAQPILIAISLGPAEKSVLKSNSRGPGYRFCAVLKAHLLPNAMLVCSRTVSGIVAVTMTANVGIPGGKQDSAG